MSLQTLFQDATGAQGIEAKLDEIISQLKILNGIGSVWKYTSDVTSVPTSTNTPALAYANPIVHVKSPSQDMILKTMAIGWDLNTAQNYKYLAVVNGMTDANPSFKHMSQASLSINELDNNSVPVPANSDIYLYAYNYNSATTAGNLQLYLLGFLKPTR